MHNPLLWLGLSLFLVAVCLVAVLLVAIPVIQELSRTARSAEKLLEMLSRELPPTLQSLRSTGEELSELSGQVHEGVRSASQVVTQVDQGLETVRSQAESVRRGSISLLAGLRVAWQQWKDPDADLYYDDPTLYDEFVSEAESGVEMARGQESGEHQSTEHQSTEHQPTVNGHHASIPAHPSVNMSQNSASAGPPKEAPATPEEPGVSSGNDPQRSRQSLDEPG